ncbi:MAG: UDP-N-acetylglucosamine--N-acetylmuramyl-(pentapeptide) pyrophosphoryl-undecaprenol N-acetylglucosamine transferase [Chloroflexi bacterium]|nr:UDP-N-acetylglucosamine--N-acetylmuramyl-(pentapeptide) pyrophosphoryl-undecaprenol N-acetylglucosamine transferase [Chloroflexota bacterium]
MYLLIAGGGTGGHIYPALAVVDALRRRPNPPEIGWLGGQRGLEERIVTAAGLPLRRLALRSLRTVERDVHLVLDPVRLGLSVPQALVLLLRRRPAAIFTTGGYVAIPVLIAARLLRVPTVLWEGNVMPGRSVRATARLASIVAVSFEAACAALGRGDPTRRRACLTTGTPIRDLSRNDALAAREKLGVAPGERLVLIFGGSQAVRRLNDAVAAVLPELIERFHVVHVTGDQGYAAALAAREGLPPDRRARYRPARFLRDDMVEALVAADLVVGRAGSSTLAEVTAAALPMVVVPYPHAGGHQRANAAILADAGAAHLVEDAEFDGPALMDAVQILDDPAAHARMAAAARSLGRPGAANALAAILLALAERRPVPGADTIDRIARGAEA